VVAGELLADRERLGVVPDAEAVQLDLGANGRGAAVGARLLTIR